MTSSGKLSECSLPGLIEIICHERQTGQLCVGFPEQPGLFFFQDGELLHAEAAAHFGAEAVYLALAFTGDASFEFTPEVSPSRRTIHEPWQSVVLEGFCRLRKASPNNAEQSKEPFARAAAQTKPTWQRFPIITEVSFGGRRRTALLGAAGAVVVISTLAAVAAISGGESKKNAPVALLLPPPAAAPVMPAPAPLNATETIERLPLDSAGPIAMPQPSTTPDLNSAAMPTEGLTASDKSLGRDQSAEGQSLAAPMKAESDRAAAAVLAAGSRILQPAPLPQAEVTTAVPVRGAGDNVVARTAGTSGAPVRPGADERAQSAPGVSTPATDKEPGGQQAIVVVVQIENGRVSQAYVPNHRPGMEAYEAAALRIARGFRYPADKAGTETVTIKVNQPK